MNSFSPLKTMPLSQKNKIAFVVPWFGVDIPGGAENLTKDLVRHLKTLFDVSILTTCVKDFHSDWNHNFWKPGEYEEMGAKVLRFPVRKRDTAHFDLINAKLMKHEPVSSNEEEVFIRECVRSVALNSFLEKNIQAYDFFLYIPYMFGTTYYGIAITDARSILIPCLHDESYAYMGIYKKMFDKAGKIFFNVPSERILAEKLFPNNKEKFYTVGAGVSEVPPIHPKKFRKKYNIDHFILYAGRKDTTKNVPELISFFDRYQREVDPSLKLVLIGSAKLDLLGNKNIIDLGFVSVEDKYDAMVDALCLCQPSLNESFSIVMMESWLCEKPVLVHGDCVATRDHCDRANGGLYFNDYHTFSECLRFLKMHPQKAHVLAMNGKKYVLKNYTWDTVIQNYLHAMYA